MPASQPANFNLQEFTDVGQLMVGGRLYTYAYGTTAQKIAYTDPDGTVPHTYTADGAGGQYIALNARGELPAPLYLGDGSYDISLKRADGSMVWTRKADGVDNSSNSVLAALGANTGASRVGFIQEGVGAVPLTVQDALRTRFNVRQFGVVGDGVADDYPNLKKAINYVSSIPGGRLEGVPGDKYSISAGLVVPFDGKFQDRSSAVTLDLTGTDIIPAIGNIVCLKASRDFVTIINPTVNNVSALAGVTAFGVMPEDPTQTTTKVSQQFCRLINPVSIGVDTGIKQQPGPTVAGAASGSFYNTYENPVARNVACAIWMAGNSNALDVLNTRTTIINPMHVGGNCSFFFEAADTTLVVGGGSENITTGAWPCATPTTIYIPLQFPSHTLQNNSIRFDRFVAETGRIPYNIAAFYCALPNCVFIGHTQPSVGGQDMTQWSNAGSVGSTSERAGKLALLFAKAANGKQAYMAFDGAGASKALFASDTNFIFASPVDIQDLRTASASGQYIGGNGISVAVGGSGQNAQFYNLSNAGTGGFEFGGATYVRPDTDNACSFGTAAKRVSTFFGATGSINTSDERSKQQIGPIDPAALRALARINFVQFKFNDAVSAKGDKARWHYGVIAQQVKAAFEAEGLDPFAYGLLCYDEWTDQYESVIAERDVEIPGPDGETRTIKESYHTGEMKLVLAAGNRYGVRYDELHSLAIACLLSRLNES